MALTLEDKKRVVSEVATVAATAYSAIAAEYRGLNVENLTELRRKARESGVFLRIVKNTLAKRALAGTDFECMGGDLVGPLLLAFSMEEPGSAACLLKDFAKSHDQLKVRILAIGGSKLPATELDRLASLPTYDQAISLLMAVMRMPLDQFARTLNEVPGKLVRTVAAIRDQKQAVA